MATPIQAGDTLTAFERYIDRVPLNEELADIRAGKQDIAEPVLAESTNAVTAEVTERAGLQDWKPTRKQLVELSETFNSEGWKVFRTLMKKRLEILRETAITLSQIDPLRNKELISEEWAYHAIHRKVMDEMEPIVMDQLARLKVQE